MELKGKPNRSFGSYKPSLTIFLCDRYPRVGGGGGVLPSNRLMELCRWMGSHFRGWIDYNGVAFSIALVEWDLTFFVSGGSENSGRYGFKDWEMFISG